METLAAQPQHTHEQEDFDRYLRIYNDTTTWLAETLEGSMRTPFEYSFDGHELRASDGSAMGDIFLDSLADADRLVAKNPALAFERRRRKLELEEYGDMLEMARGQLPNTMVVVSDFPPELMHATESVGGYNPARKQTMLRVLTWREGRLHMFSQSLDGSDRQALEAVYAHFGQTPAKGELLGQRIHAQLGEEDQQYLTDRLTGIYDRSLAEQKGGQWYAGREETRHDTYQFVLGQHQLVDHFVLREMHGGINDDERYNVAALITKLFERSKQTSITITEADILFDGLAQGNLGLMLDMAGNEAKAQGKTFDGCGITARKSAQEQMNAAGYGNQREGNELEDKYGSLEFYCTNGHWNIRPFGKLVTQCRIRACKDSVSC